MGESLNVVEPSGVAIRVAGSVVARPPRVRIDDIREGFVTVDPAGMRVPLEEAHVTSTVTTGWLFGRQVDVLPGRETRYVIAGYADESTGPPRGGAQLADDGSYRLATDDLSDLVALRAVVDTVISPPSGALAGAHLARAESGVDAPLRLASLAPVPVPASPTRPGLQLGDGAVMPMGHTSSRMWSFARGERSGREVDVLAEREGSAWIATDRPVRRGDRMLNARLAAGVESVYTGWVPVREIDREVRFRREWSSDDGVALLHGDYARVDGMWRSLSQFGLPRLRRDGLELRQPGHTLIRGTVPVPLDSDDYEWAAFGGGRSVADDEIVDRLRLRTSARLAGRDVELATPWDPMTDGDLLFVQGGGTPWPPTLLSDGFLVEASPTPDGGWAAQVRRDHLTDVRTEVVE